MGLFQCGTYFKFVQRLLDYVSVFSTRVSIEILSSVIFGLPVHKTLMVELMHFGVGEDSLEREKS